MAGPCQHQLSTCSRRLPSRPGASSQPTPRGPSCRGAALRPSFSKESWEISPAHLLHPQPRAFGFAPIVKPSGWCPDGEGQALRAVVRSPWSPTPQWGGTRVSRACPGLTRGWPDPFPAPPPDPVVPLPAWGPSEQSPTVPPELFTLTLASPLLELFLQPARATALLPTGNLPRLQREGRAGTQASAELDRAPLLAHQPGALGPDSGGSVHSFQDLALPP